MKKKSIIQTLGSAFMGITFAYFVWLLWRKLTEVVGTGWEIFAITGGIVLFGILTGWFSIGQILKKFGVE